MLTPAPKLRTLIASTSMLVTLAGCTTTPTVDSKHWTSYRESIDGAVIEYSLPDGFERGGDQPFPFTHFRRSYSSGALSATGAGSRKAETNIDICISDPYYDYDEFKEDFFKGDTPTSVSTFESDWELLVFDFPDDKVMTRFYVRLLDQHHFLFVRGELKGAVYADEGLRRPRIRLLEDVTRKVRATSIR